MSKIEIEKKIELMFDYRKNIIKRLTTNKDIIENIYKVATTLYSTMILDKKIFIVGNGGSAADAQHFAAELNGRFIEERRSLPAISLTTNSSLITAIGNDFGFSEIFSRQIEGLAESNDVLFLISTSGKSENILRAMEVGKKIGCINILLTGEAPDDYLINNCRFYIQIPSIYTPFIQECHIMIIHILCQLIDSWISKNEIF